MFITETCSWRIDTAQPNESALVAARRMNDRNVGALVILDEQKHLQGIITDRDIAMRVTATGKVPSDTPLSDVMTHNPVSVDETTSAYEALRIMRSGGFRRLPVLNGQQEVTGIVTMDDLLVGVANLFRDLEGVIKAEGPDALANP